MYAGILPHPQEYETGTGTLAPERVTQCRVSGLAPSTLAILDPQLPGIAVERVDEEGFRAVLGPSNATLCVSEHVANAAPEREEGYLLRITPDRVEIAARDAAGLWYGFQTLRQALRSGGLPVGEVRDWPAIRRRGVHIDLKGYQPKFDRLLELCDLLAEHKINTILLEVEDKYAFSSAPGVGVERAYTREQFRRLSVECAARFIQVIPKLQCLGHVDYILTHEQYAHLRENGHPYQYCPRNDEAAALWKGMAEELIDCFREHDYFHVGADETANLGECPVCAPYSKAQSYVHMVGRCIDVVLEAGKRPIMWEDILRNAHGHLTTEELRTTWTLGGKCILNYWSYGAWAAGQEAPMLPAYLDAGMTVWGASAFSGAGPTMIEDVPPLTERAANIAGWTRLAQQRDLAGVIATSWTKFRSGDPPAESMEAAWVTLLFAAESMWWGKERGLEEFCRVMSTAFWGIDITPDYGRFLRTMNSADLPRDAPVLRPTRNAERLRLLLAGCEFFHHTRIRSDVYYLMHMYHDTFGRKQPDYILDRNRVVNDRLRESIERRGRMLEEALAVFYDRASVAEVMGSRFGRDRELVRQMDGLIDRTERS